MNVLDSIRATAGHQPAHTAVIEGHRRTSYRALLDRVDEMARAWQSKGLASGQRVAFVYPDGTEYIVGSLAILSLGAAVVPVSPTLMADDAVRVIRDLDVHWVISTPDDPVWRVAEADKWPILWRGDSFVVAGRTAASTTRPGYEEIAPAFIRFTSGTTGSSKGVVLSHQTIIERTDAADRGLSITPDDVVLWVLSMSFHFVVTILLFLRRGATLVLCQQPFPGALVDGIRFHGGTFLYASPFHYHLLAAASGLEPDELKRVRSAVCTATKLPSAIADACAKRLGLELAEAYGIIEVGLPFVQRTPAPARRGSLGVPLPDYARALPIRTPMAWVRSCCRGPACWMPTSRRGARVPRFWMVAGFTPATWAASTMDGSLRIVGRSKHVINFNGMKVFPDEVEKVLARHSAVNECRVVGDQHPLHGQIPAAEVVVDPGQDPAVVFVQLAEMCARQLAPFKRPRDYRAVTSLPRTASGKIRRT